MRRSDSMTLVFSAAALSALVGCGGADATGTLEGAVYLPASGAVPVADGAEVCKNVTLTFTRPTQRPPPTEAVTPLPATATWSAAHHRCEYALPWPAAGGQHPWNVRVAYTGPVRPTAAGVPWDEVFPVVVDAGATTHQDFYLHLPGKTGLPGDYCTNSGDCTRGLSCDGGMCLTAGHKPGAEAERCRADADCVDGRTCNSGRCGTCAAGTTACDRFAPPDSQRSLTNGCCDDATSLCEARRSPPVCEVRCVDNTGCGPEACCDATLGACATVGKDHRGPDTGVCPTP